METIFSWLKDCMYFNIGTMRWENLALGNSKCPLCFESAISRAECSNVS